MKISQPMWTLTNGDEIPVGTMYCIGRNYAAHAAEMGASLPADPIVFIKPPAAFRQDGSTIALPTWSSDVHHEVELVVVIGTASAGITEERAWSIVAGVGVGLDLTARDIQSAAKESGQPWAVAKSWTGSAPVSTIVPLSSSGTGPWTLECSVNGHVMQHASTHIMEHSVERLISYLSSVFTLQPGDCIFTGTPDGVGPVGRGNVVTATLSDIASLTVQFE